MDYSGIVSCRDTVSNLRAEFENLVELALTEPVDLVVLAGDLYDGDWRDYNTGLYFVSQMARLREAGIRVFLVAGNHDAANRMTRSLRLPKGGLALGQPSGYFFPVSQRQRQL